jgi:hypothetical protein
VYCRIDGSSLRWCVAQVAPPRSTRQIAPAEDNGIWLTEGTEEPAYRLVLRRLFPGTSCARSEQRFVYIYAGQEKGCRMEFIVGTPNRNCTVETRTCPMARSFAAWVRPPGSSAGS